MQKIADHQEVMGAIADIVIEVYAMDSVLARTLKLTANGGNAKLATAMTDVYMAGAMARVEAAARKVLADVADGDMLRTQMTILRRLVKSEPVNVIAARQLIATHMLEAGKYTL
jgi:butyryl-CoA dehydrogenase